MRRFIQSIASDAYRRFGDYIPRWAFYPLYQWVYPPGSAKPMMMYIDIVGSCNLRCPSCPIGNTENEKGGGRLALSVFEQILQKAKREFGIVGVALFNWTEPFLHPDLPEFIRCVKRENLICTLSSNLNLIRRADDVLLAKPDTLRISLSGYTQAIYGQTHVHGEIETVKRNMRLLSEAKKRLRNRRTAIYVYYHKYLHNLDEVEPMKQFARSLGFDWLEDWAYYMPLERVIELAEGRLSPEKKRFVDDHLALPIDKAIDEARLFKKEACGLLHDQIVLDAAGDIHICCAAYEKRTTRLGRFLEMTPDEVRNAKTRHPLCARCSAHGLHRYFEYTTHPILRKKYAALVEEKLSRTQR